MSDDKKKKYGLIGGLVSERGNPSQKNFGSNVLRGKDNKQRAIDHMKKKNS